MSPLCTQKPLVRTYAEIPPLRPENEPQSCLVLRPQHLQEIDEGDSQIIHHHFIKSALQPLVTMLLEQLLKQEEDQEKEDTAWNLSMAAGTCLDLIATVVEDDIIPLVMPFVQVLLPDLSGGLCTLAALLSRPTCNCIVVKVVSVSTALVKNRPPSSFSFCTACPAQANIERKAAPEDWRYREAATFAFGSILEGPSPAQLVQLVNMGLTFFLSALKDPNSQVRHTTAWTVGALPGRLLFAAGRLPRNGGESWLCCRPGV